MNNQKRDISVERTNQARQTAPVLAALVVGGLMGAGAMMLLAPQSGKETRSKIHDKTMQLRDRTVGGVQGAVKQVTSRTHAVTDDVKEKAGVLEQRGRDVVADQLDKVAAAATAGKKAVKG